MRAGGTVVGRMEGRCVKMHVKHLHGVQQRLPGILGQQRSRTRKSTGDSIFQELEPQFHPEYPEKDNPSKGSVNKVHKSRRFLFIAN